MLEEERKFGVDAAFTMPDLSSCAPKGGRVLPVAPVTLRATYYDTADRRLARAGVSLRHRRGEAPAKAWTVKLPTDAAPSVRHEFHRPGDAKHIPAQLAGLVTGYHRGAPLAPAAVVRTVRRAYEIRDRDERVLAEIADDTVSVLDGRRVTLAFREIEVERVDGDDKLLDRVGKALTKAGAEGGSFVPKHVRALGEQALAPADLVPADRLPSKPTAAQVVVAALRKDIGRIFEYDPFVRLRQPLPDGDTPVHQMRVGTRRLRSDLRTFGKLIDPQFAAALRDELRWLADALGAARDAEVLRARLYTTAAADPLAPIDAGALDRIDATLAARHDAALAALDEVLASERYTKLLDALVDAARQPKLRKASGKPAHSVLPKLVGKPWRKLAGGGGGLPGAAELAVDAPDADWHGVRVRGKRARYATEAVAGVLGGGARKLAKALAAVQEQLGEHQDAAVAGQTWLDVAAAGPDDHASNRPAGSMPDAGDPARSLAVAAGRLYERERAAVRRARSRFPAAWKQTTKAGVTDWLT